MKKTKFFLTLILLIAVSASAAGEVQNFQKAFEEGEAKYQKNDYPGAIKIYEGILSRGVASESLYFNLGNAYFKVQNLGKAILNYERALKLSPDDKELRHNLSFVRELLQDKLEAPEAPRWLQKLMKLHRLLTLNAVAILASLCYSVIILLFSYAVVKSSFHPVFFRVFLIPLVVFLIFLIGVGSFKISEERFSPAIVIAEELDVHYGPSTHETKALVLHAGTKCAVKEVSGDWILIWLPNDRGGWVQKSGIERI